MATPTYKPGEQEPDDHACSEPVGDDDVVICQTATASTMSKAAASIQIRTDLRMRRHLDSDGTILGASRAVR